MPKTETAVRTVPLSTQGMDLNQLLTMLEAAKSQGATHVQLACRTPGKAARGIASDIDWVSMAPVGDSPRTVYVGAILAVNEWPVASSEALESLDW